MTKPIRVEAMRARASNISKRERARRAVKPEFALTGIVVGAVVGWIAGAGLEIGLGRLNMLVMIASTFAGIVLGGAVEGIRFFIRMRLYSAALKT